MTFWSNKSRTFNLPKKFNISVMGSRGCGKSSIVNRFMYGNLETPKEKISIDNIHHFHIKNGSKKISFDILDTTDSYYYPTAMRKFPIADSQAFVLVYALDDPDSFDEAINIYNEICKQRNFKPGIRVPIVFVVNKCDQWDDETTLMDRVISQSTVEIDLERVHVEASAIDNTNIIDIFENVLQLVGCIFPLKETMEQQRLSKLPPEEPKSFYRRIFSRKSKKLKDSEASKVKIQVIDIEDDPGSSLSDNSCSDWSDYISNNSLHPRKASLPSSALYKKIWASYETVHPDSSIISVNDKDNAKFRKRSLDSPRRPNDLRLPRKQNSTEPQESDKCQFMKMMQNRHRNDPLYTPLIDVMSRQNSPKSTYGSVQIFDFDTKSTSRSTEDDIYGFSTKTKSRSAEDEINKMAESELEDETETAKSLMDLCKNVQKDAFCIMQCLPRRPKHYIRYYD